MQIEITAFTVALIISILLLIFDGKHDLLWTIATIIAIAGDLISIHFQRSFSYQNWVFKVLFFALAAIIIGQDICLRHSKKINDNSNKEKQHKKE